MKPPTAFVGVPSVLPDVTAPPQLNHEQPIFGYLSLVLLFLIWTTRLLEVSTSFLKVVLQLSNKLSESDKK